MSSRSSVKFDATAFFPDAETFAVDYVGAIPVASSSLSKSLWKMFGPQVVDDVGKKLKKLNPKHSASILCVSPSSIAVVDDNTGTFVDNEQMVDMRYASVFPTDAKRVAYVNFYKHIGLLYCHVIACKDKALAAAVVTAINAAVTKATEPVPEFFGFDGNILKLASPASYSTDASSSGKRKEIDSLGQIVGVVESLRYVGTVPLRVAGGESGEVVEEDVIRGVTYMWKQLKQATKATPKKERRISFTSRKSSASADPLNGLPVVLVVSAEGIRTIDNISREETHRVFLQDLAFFTDVQVKKEKTGELFVTVSRDHRLKHVRLRVYRCGEKKQGPDICETVRKAFTASNRASELRNGQPFMPLANLASDIELDTPLLRLEIPRENVMPIRTVGAGQFGLVFAVNVRDDAEGLSYERAAKVLRAGASPDTMANFLREAEVLRQLNHRNVVRLRGVCLRQQPWLIIEDYMLYGDLDAVLTACTEKEVVLTEAEFLYMVYQIVSGMAYVSGEGVIHSDLAAKNCLLHSDNVVQIADFGWSTKLPAGKASLTAAEIPRISTRWLAVECMDKQVFSEKSDVWACGITMWECYSYAKTPYESIHFLQVPRMVTEGTRLERPLNCPHDIFSVMSKCWEKDPSKRPRFKEMEKKLAEMVQFYRKAGSLPPPRDLGPALTGVVDDFKGSGGPGGDGGGASGGGADGSTARANAGSSNIATDADAAAAAAELWGSDVLATPLAAAVEGVGGGGTRASAPRPVTAVYEGGGADDDGAAYANEAGNRESVCSLEGFGDSLGDMPGGTASAKWASGGSSGGGGGGGGGNRESLMLGFEDTLDDGDDSDDSDDALSV